ncbi:cytochrome c [Myxococcus sp. CA051A]|uniref:c-type cytochrome n=1 Tax=unclassified Myxococcus TaxID=2648731 RepID=UPI00157BACA0|nr:MULTISPECIES: c-type cytochrome [unclassified Myxococcus]NTX09373.1 cytochrome c [Myxococcus sp. CA056]NTX37735.1 cytochrome c [Myxococcus sp. CA033]NTX50621.1 cytochrome c [Myxococcus sp. CA039A]NTX61209.1 cytochrome c [Myxococcus sp. CA051A]
MMKRVALVMSLCLAPSVYAEDEVADVWKAKCKSCHGDDGKAQTKMGKKESIVDMSQAAWQAAESDADIRQAIADGSPRNTKMKAFKDKLTAAQIDALVGYIRTMKAK